ncbi:uncharacterized protein NECHADRAFT_102587 [Fusarium vanettenii 77-13-4]|uniref:Uncharacterized protein n=1 Tax=Fusarium vanettenii (strain ATCC MYA-4622 / CBS 123669 / FGSC 9596 / NRRL 45880 / 77-13-4) TaxID=660122 RepID=C7YNQ6_FUSV7|nr:uncharacterized protein NECHADRAFT_102587 [Fusarium vanettenii 77-13-4]EEU46157.1 hypothetical protein NECHADRAFT_102587 [Fusarium vanettenii 77-13-4]
MHFYSITALFMAVVAIAAPANEVQECCCCNINEPAIVCTQRALKDCICPAVMCPEDAPTLRPNSPTPTAIEKRQAEEETPKSEPCCCCNAGRGAIVCTIRKPEEDQTCMCPMVLCPSDAPTVTEGPGVAKETGN